MQNLSFALFHYNTVILLVIASIKADLCKISLVCSMSVMLRSLKAQKVNVEVNNK